MTPSVFAIFCDDIRHEINGKFTLVGCYGSDYLVTKFPHEPSKLCISFRIYCEPKDEKQNIKLIVSKDDQSLFQVEFDIDPAQHEFQDDYIEIGGGMELPKLTFEEPCTIKTSAMVNDLYLDGPKLKVALQNQSKEGQQEQPSSTPET